MPASSPTYQAFRILAIASLLLVQVFAVGGCSTTTTSTQFHPDGTRTLTRRDSHGDLLNLQRFYIDSRGHKVLHGDSEVFDPRMNTGICKTYDHGILVRTASIFVNQ